MKTRVCSAKVKLVGKKSKTKVKSKIECTTFIVHIFKDR